MSEHRATWVVALLTIMECLLAANMQVHSSFERTDNNLRQHLENRQIGLGIKGKPINRRNNETIILPYAPQPIFVYPTQNVSQAKNSLDNTNSKETVYTTTEKSETMQPLPDTQTQPIPTSEPTVHDAYEYEEQSCINSEPYDEKLSLDLSKDVLQLAQKLLNIDSDGRYSDKDTEVISPTCIMGALLLPMLGANTQTYDEFTHLFSKNIARGLTSGSYNLHKEFSLLLYDAVSKKQYSNLKRPSDPWRYTPHKFQIRPAKAINDTSDYKLRIANGIFVHKDFPLRQDYRAAVRAGYRTQIKSFDFRHEAEQARKCINSLIKSKTKGKIDQILAGTLSAQTNLIITSSIYFNAKWERQFFLGGATRYQDFYPNGIENPPEKTLMMATGGLFPYYNDTEGRCQIIGLPYRGNLTTMYVIIPYNSNRTRLQDFHKTLTADKIEGLISKMELKTTTMLFPKMDIKNSMRLRNVFTELGLNRLFDPMQSDLSLITDREAEVVQSNAFDDCIDTDDDEEESESVEVKENPDPVKFTTLPPIYATLPPRIATEQPTQEIEVPTIRPTEPPVPVETCKPEVEDDTLPGPTTTTESTSSKNLEPKAYTKCSNRGFGTSQQPTRRSVSAASVSPKQGQRQNNQDEISQTDYQKILQNYNKSRQRAIETGFQTSYNTFFNYEWRSGRRRRHTCRSNSELDSFRNLEEIRHKEGLYNPQIFADEIVHKIDLTVNELGTEGGAATAITLHRNAPEVSLRVEVPFIFLIRHDPTRLPIFYGLVYKPTQNPVS